VINDPKMNQKLARIVAQSWMDPEFKKQVLEQPKQVFAKEGIEVPDDVQLTVLEDSATHRNLVLSAHPLPAKNIVSTLPQTPNFFQVYSYAYTKALEDPAFKTGFMADPVGTFQRLGAQLPPGTSLSVHNSTEQHRYFTLPVAPKARVLAEALTTNAVTLDATAVNANVNLNANAAVNTNGAVNINGALQVNGAAVATVVVAVAVLI
jgi:hypothetical protein